MYAVVEIGGHQYRVSEGDVIFVDKQSDEAGITLNFDRVMLIKDDNGGVIVGKPVIEGASVTADLVDNVKADKLIVFKKKRRKGYQKRTGHRQTMSRLEITDISSSGGAKKSAKSTKKDEKAKTDSASGKEAAESKAKAKSEAKSESKSKPKADAKSGGEAPTKVSTDMNAKEAIDHIRNTPLEELEGFVPGDEDRVTVQRAWESKQEE
ncbi:MAG: 50S ribosomal protein L21 [Balneolaceae bacterium]|nr:50S ribosomal protein L21 [Balneolaceae bacterium]